MADATSDDERPLRGRRTLGRPAWGEDITGALGVTPLEEVTMFEAGDIREWRGHDVVDRDGHKIGTLESVYVDTVTDQAFFATVTMGLPTRRRLAFVPLGGATVGPGYVKVTYSKDVVKKAPAIDTDGELPATEEPAVFAHYELDYATGAGGERRLARR